MATPPNSLPSKAFSRSEAQDIMDAAQIKAGQLYADAPYLRKHLQESLHDAIIACNSSEADPMDILYHEVGAEQIILDAYNRHRLGNSITAYNSRVVNPEDVVEYLEEENIPEQLEFFPLRSELSNRGLKITKDPIYQLPGTVEHNQEFTARAGVSERPATETITAAGRNPTTKTKNQKKKKKTSSGTQNYNKLRDAPSPLLAFPRGNLTMAEMAAFIPHSLKSIDVMDRVIRNGAFTATLAEMMNYFREMKNGPITNNSTYKMMKNGIDKDGKLRWTVAKHAGLVEMPIDFDPTSVSVSDFRTPNNQNMSDADAAAQQPELTILFRNLADGVKVMPSGYDALDLTRCVEYCVENEDDDWHYPQDFEELVEQLGGPADVNTEHQDAAAVRRHISDSKLRSARLTGQRERDKNGRLFKRDNGKSAIEPDEEEATDEDLDEDSDQLNSGTSDDEDNEPSTRGIKRKHNASGQTVRRPFRVSGTTGQNFDSDSDSDNYIGPKNQKKQRTATRSSGRATRFSGSFDVDKALELEEDEDEDVVSPAEGPRSLADIRDSFRQRNADKATQSAARRAKAAAKDEEEDMSEENLEDEVEDED
jgi:hypothetical protein